MFQWIGIKLFQLIGKMLQWIGMIFQFNHTIGKMFQWKGKMLQLISR